jgi:sigma-B regulation protein RsbU (phosphoserine phosphatase)
MSDQNKSIAELLDEINSLKNMRAELQRRYDALAQKFDHECLERDQTEVELSMAQVIIDESPAILFRREAGGDRKLVYVSNNISQLGYKAEKLLSGEMHFREIVYPDDMEALAAEIQELAEKDVE